MNTPSLHSRTKSIIIGPVGAVLAAARRNVWMNRRSRTGTGRKPLLGARRSRGASAGADSLRPAVCAGDPRLFRELRADVPVLFEVEDPGCTAPASSSPEVISTCLRRRGAASRGGDPAPTPNRDDKVPVTKLSGWPFEPAAPSAVMRTPTRCRWPQPVPPLRPSAARRRPDPRRRRAPHPQGDSGCSSAWPPRAPPSDPVQPYTSLRMVQREVPGDRSRCWLERALH